MNCKHKYRFRQYKLSIKNEPLTGVYEKDMVHKEWTHIDMTYDQLNDEQKEEMKEKIDTLPKCDCRGN